MLQCSADLSLEVLGVLPDMGHRGRRSGEMEKSKFYHQPCLSKLLNLFACDCIVLTWCIFLCCFSQKKPKVGSAGEVVCGLTDQIIFMLVFVFFPRCRAVHIG